MSNYKPLYMETDSVKYKNLVKAMLNSGYGTLEKEKYMNREYISVFVEKDPTVIFKRNIIAVTKSSGSTMITCVGDVVFYTKENYASVVKKIIGE